MLRPVVGALVVIGLVYGLGLVDYLLHGSRDSLVPNCCDRS